jgi:hypothetical protein
MAVPTETVSLLIEAAESRDSPTTALSGWTKNVTPSAANGPMMAGRRRDVMLFDGNLDAEMRNRGAVNYTRLR